MCLDASAPFCPFDVMPLHVEVDVDYAAAADREDDVQVRKRTFNSDNSRRWREIRGLRAAAAAEIAADKAARKEKLRQQEERIARLREKNIKAAVDEVRRRRVLREMRVNDDELVIFVAF